MIIGFGDRGEKLCKDSVTKSDRLLLNHFETSPSSRERIPEGGLMAKEGGKSEFERRSEIFPPETEIETSQRKGGTGVETGVEAFFAKGEKESTRGFLLTVETIGKSKTGNAKGGGKGGVFRMIPRKKLNKKGRLPIPSRGGGPSARN